MHPFLGRFEREEGLVRGALGSERAAMMFGDYFPNPAVFGTGEAAQVLVSPATALVVEAFGTAVLVFVIFALRSGQHRAPSALVSPQVGATAAALICIFGPVTQAGWHPARDLGQRLVSLLAGYGSIALPGSQGGFWVYLLGPLLGGAVGGGLAEWVVRRPAAELLAPERAEDRVRLSGANGSRASVPSSVWGQPEPKATNGNRTDRELHEAVHREVERLHGEFKGVFSEQTIQQYVDDSYHHLSTGARVKWLIPQLTYRLARKTLQTAASEGSSP